MSQSNVSLEPTDCATRVIMSHLPTKEKQTISAHKNRASALWRRPQVAARSNGGQTRKQRSISHSCGKNVKVLSRRRNYTQGEIHTRQSKRERFLAPAQDVELKLVQRADEVRIWRGNDGVRASPRQHPWHPCNPGIKPSCPLRLCVLA